MAQVLLTGCCGFLGSWIARRLAEDGHQVRGSTQDPAYARSVLGGLDVEVVRAELLEPESWRGLAEDCEVVVHTACPVVTEVGVPREAMIDPALVGTETVLREAARAGTVRRVVHLSSIVTLLDHHLPAERCRLSMCLLPTITISYPQSLGSVQSSSGAPGCQAVSSSSQSPPWST